MMRTTEIARRLNKARFVMQGRRLECSCGRIESIGIVIVDIDIGVERLDHASQVSGTSPLRIRMGLRLRLWLRLRLRGAHGCQQIGLSAFIY